MFNKFYLSTIILPFLFSFFVFFFQKVIRSFFSFFSFFFFPFSFCLLLPFFFLPLTSSPPCLQPQHVSMSPVALQLATSLISLLFHLLPNFLFLSIATCITAIPSK